MNDYNDNVPRSSTVYSHPSDIWHKIRQIQMNVKLTIQVTPIEFAYIGIDCKRITSLQVKVILGRRKVLTRCNG